MTLTIYHNPRCKKSRAGLQYLIEHKIDHQIIEYIKHPIDEKKITSLLAKLNFQPQELIREQETLFKTHFKGKDFSSSEWITILAEHPKLIKRPIVEHQYHAIIAQPPENIQNLLLTSSIPINEHSS